MVRKTTQKKVATHDDIYGTSWPAWHYQQERIDVLLGTIESQKQTAEAMGEKLIMLEAEVTRNSEIIQCLDNANTFTRLRSSGYTSVSAPSMIPQPDLAAQLAALTERVEKLEARSGNWDDCPY